MEMATKEDYLNVIYHLDRQQERSLIKNVQLAAKMNVKPPSITEMVRKLHQEGYITWIKHHGFHLTPRGREVAKALLARREVIATFLTKVLGLNDDALVARIQHLLEHVHEQEFIDAIRIFTNNMAKAH